MEKKNPETKVPDILEPNVEAEASEVRDEEDRENQEKE